MINQIRRLMDPIYRMICMMVGRAVINLANDGLAVQELQINLLADETRSGVERFQEYGFTSNPHPGAEGVMVCVGGARDHGIVIAVEDRRYRLKGLAEGEVALYDDQGQAVHLKRGKKIHAYGCEEVLVEAAVKATCTAPEVTANSSVKHQVNSPEISLGGDRNTLRALIDERFIALYNAHVHPDGGAPAGQLTVASVATDVVKGL
jgi:phage baseplate assembly protein V